MAGSYKAGISAWMLANVKNYRPMQYTAGKSKGKAAGCALQSATLALRLAMQASVMPNETLRRVRGCKTASSAASTAALR